MISDKEIVLEVVLSEFKEITLEFESSFNKYEYYKQTLRNDYECSGKCLEFYQYFLEFNIKHPSDFKKAYQCSVVKLNLRS